MHRRHFDELVDLMSDTPQLSQVNVFIFGLEGVELTVRGNGNDIFSKLSATVSTPQDLVPLRYQPLSQREVNSTSLSRPNQPFFD